MPLFNGIKGCTRDQSWSKCMDHSVCALLYSVLCHILYEIQVSKNAEHCMIYVV